MFASAASDTDWIRSAELWRPWLGDLIAFLLGHCSQNVQWCLAWACDLVAAPVYHMVGSQYGEDDIHGPNKMSNNTNQELKETIHIQCQSQTNQTYLMSLSFHPRITSSDLSGMQLLRGPKGGLHALGMALVSTLWSEPSCSESLRKRLQAHLRRQGALSTHSQVQNATQSFCVSYLQTYYENMGSEYRSRAVNIIRKMVV